MELEYVANGDLYTVYRLVDREGTWALKVPRSGLDRSDRYVSTTRFSSTATMGGISTAWNLITSTGASPAAFKEKDAVALLADEADRIRATGGAWNHEVRWFKRFEVDSEMKWALCTRWFDGTALKDVPRDRARPLFPLMLPAMWDALCVAVHGDLHAGNILVGDQRFALIDPGAMIVTTRGEQAASSGARNLDFISHATAYPMLPPFMPPIPDGVRLEDAWRLWLLSQTTNRLYDTVKIGNVAAQYFDGLRDTPSVPVPAQRPLPGDVHALGILYYELLTGTHPYPLLLERGPAWKGIHIVDNHISGELLGDAVIAAPPAPPSTLDDSVSPREDALALALLDLAFDSRDDLVRAIT
jgi:hypothetical protein